MRVAITAIGTNHYFHLARGLAESGNLVKVFSGYPWKRLEREKLDHKYVECFPWIQTPYMLLGRSKRPLRALQRELCFLANKTLSLRAASRLPDVDVFVGQSNCGLEVGRKAKANGKLWICDRPASHIRFQDDILRSEFGRLNVPYEPIDPRIIDREELEYAEADHIVVGSTFARNSFLAMGVAGDRVTTITYGADASRFSPQGSPDPDRFEVLFAGNASIQKGVPIVLEAFSRIEHPAKRLRFVGTVLPEIARILDRFPTENVEFLGPRPQPELASIMSQSTVTVLPSVQEGFGMVIAEAMACGCPVIASTHSGGPDLVEDGISGFLVKPGDVDDLVDRLQLLADQPDRANSMRASALSRARQSGGWPQYVQKYIDLVEAKYDKR